MNRLVEEFKKLDSTCVSDALDRLGVPCAMLGIKEINIGSKVCGEAFTVHYVPCGVNKGTVGDFLDDVEPGQVIVIDNSGRLHATVWGDIMTFTATNKGIAGTVIDGVCRDIPMIRELGYPIFAKDYYMSTGKDRVEVDAVNVPVSIGGVQVRPGDIILGDDSGVIVIPIEKAEEALKIALDIEEKEHQIIALVKEGNTLKDARKKLGYHHLQTKR